MFNHGLTYLAPDDELPDHIRANPLAAKYAKRISERLKISTISEAIPGGLDCLPDFYSEIPEFYKAWMKLRRPRNYEQFLDHLVQYLEFYVEPERKPTITHFAVTTLGIVTVMLILVIGIIVSLMPQHMLPPFFSWFTSGVGSILILVVFFVPFDDRSVGYKQEVNATLLYQYLRDAYSDEGLPTISLHEKTGSRRIDRTPALEGYPPKKKLH